MVSSFIHFPTDGIISFFAMALTKSHCVYVVYALLPLHLLVGIP